MRLPSCRLETLRYLYRRLFEANVRYQCWGSATNFLFSQVNRIREGHSHYQRARGCIISALFAGAPFCVLELVRLERSPKGKPAGGLDVWGTKSQASTSLSENAMVPHLARFGLEHVWSKKQKSFSEKGTKFDIPKPVGYGRTQLTCLFPRKIREVVCRAAGTGYPA